MALYSQEEDTAGEVVVERFERFCLSEDIQAGEVLVGNCMRSCVSDLFPRGSNVHAGRGHSRGDAGAAVLAVICFWVQLYSLQRGDVFGAGGYARGCSGSGIWWSGVHDSVCPRTGCSFPRVVMY